MKDLFLKSILYGGCILVAILLVDLVSYIVEMVRLFEALELLETLDKEAAEIFTAAIAESTWSIVLALLIKVFTLLFVGACMIGFFQLDDKINRLYERKLDKPNQEPLDKGY